MLKHFIAILSLFLISTSSVLAAGFVLNHIGSLDTGGNQYDEWWYQGQNPTLSGTTAPSAAVEVNVDGTTQTVTADASGNWSAATTMPTDDHTVTLTSGGSVISFTLHLNQEMPADIGAPAASTQPVVGVVSPTLLLLVFGLGLAAFGLIYRRHSHL